MYQLSMENIYQSDPYNYQNNTAPYLLGDTTHYYLYPREFSLNYNFPTSQILYQFNQNLSTKTSTIWQPFDYFKNGVVPCIYNDTLYMASLDFSINYSIIKHPLHPSHFKPFDLPDTEFIGTNNSKEVEFVESHVATHRNAFLHTTKYARNCPTGEICTGIHLLKDQAMKSTLEVSKSQITVPH